MRTTARSVGYLELRQELEAKGHRFVTGTDTEVILHIYTEYGSDGFDRLNGIVGFRDRRCTETAYSAEPRSLLDKTTVFAKA